MAAAAPITHCALAVTMGIPPVEALVDVEPVAERLDADASVDFEPEVVAVAVAPLAELPMAPAVIVTGTGGKRVARFSKEVLSTEEKDEKP